MRIEQSAGTTIVTLSRRNLLTLLAKLDGHPRDSACAIGAPAHYGSYYVHAEEDEEHYNNAERVATIGDNLPGIMHPDTEEALA